MFKLYRPKVWVEAIQWRGEENCRAVFSFLGWDHDEWSDETDHTEIYIPTEDETLTATHGDWIIRGFKGRIFLCKPEEFEDRYEPVE